MKHHIQNPCFCVLFSVSGMELIEGGGESILERDIALEAAPQDVLVCLCKGHALHGHRCLGVGEDLLCGAHIWFPFAKQVHIGPIIPSAEGSLLICEALGQGNRENKEVFMKLWQARSRD